MAQNDNTEIVDEAVAPEAEAPQGEPGPALSLEELNMLMQIVDLAVQRGAFRGNEISQVGAVYDKLNAFLGAVAQANKPEEGEAPVEQEAAPEEE